MSEDFKDIPAPTAPTGVVGPDQAVVGPKFLPQQQIRLYSSDEWEALTISSTVASASG